MTKTIKETIREYDKDGKMIKEAIKETTESDIRTVGGSSSGTEGGGGRYIQTITPEWIYRPELSPYCGGGWG